MNFSHGSYEVRNISTDIRSSLVGIEEMNGTQHGPAQAYSPSSVSDMLVNCDQFYRLTLLISSVVKIRTDFCLVPPICY